jgi:vancomycin resistance protein YoaR
MQAMNGSTYEPKRLIRNTLLSLLTGGVFFVTLALVFVLGYELVFTNRIFDNVRVGGVDVSGQGINRAAAMISADILYASNGSITFTYNGQSWQASPSQLGLYFDPYTSARDAFQVGRTGNLLERMAEPLGVARYGREVAPVFILDEKVARQYLENLAQQVDIPAVEAAVTLTGLEVGVRDGQVGRRLDMDATLAALCEKFQTLQSDELALVVEDVLPQVLDAGPAAEQARQILGSPLTLTLPGGQADPTGLLSVDPQQLAGMLAFERVQGDNGVNLQVTVDEDQMRAFLANMQSDLHLDPQNTRFTFNDETRQLEVIQSAVTGQDLNIDGSITAIKQGIAAGQHSIPLVFDFTPPVVTDEMTGVQLGITELIASQSTYFRGSSAARIQNIRTAAARFHGLLIAPGETFSMAQALGDISLDNGYAEALIIVGDRTVQGVGGGVCQVSTTLFRTAFFAGLPILERHAHAYRVKYYEQTSTGHSNSLAGLDATVYFPLVDLKFKNDTPYWILMETYIYSGASMLEWKFYSTSDGRIVTWDTTGPVNVVEPPKDEYKQNDKLAKGEIEQVDWAVEGADVTVYRTVTKNGAVYLQDSFFTHYEPWPNIFEYGQGTEVPPPPAKNSSP